MEQKQTEKHQSFLADSFQQHLLDSYANYCEKYSQEESLKGFIHFLMDRNLLQEVKVRQFTIQKEFDRIYPIQNYHKSKTVALLADLFNISKRYVWSLLRNYKNENQEEA